MSTKEPITPRWEWHDTGAFWELRVNNGRSKRLLAKIYSTETKQLLEAAPDLLACCQRALTTSARVHPDFLAQLLAAIAKATGAE